MKTVNFIFVSLFMTPLFATPLDIELRQLIKANKLVSLEKPPEAKIEIIKLGSNLFHETELAGPRNISCAHCHHPRFGTADAIPFSIGQGGKGIGTNRVQENAGLTKRHSPHLLNLGYKEQTHMFWDGRVSRDPVSGALTTPEPKLNGTKPELKEIASTLSSALAAQTIFPIADSLEMKGVSGNDVADSKNTVDAWATVMKRLTTGAQSQRYLKLFKKAFPDSSKYHIGHVGEGLAAFLARSFALNDTPYDKYLSGDMKALTHSEKKGLKVFIEQGKCIKCHTGALLSDQKFHSVAIPQVFPQGGKGAADRGRFEVTRNPKDLFAFRTPGLRNLKITAPYMHDGVFNNIKEVIEHYEDPKKSLNTFVTDQMVSGGYTVKLKVDQHESRNLLRLSQVDEQDIRNGIKITEKEKKDLIQFLETGLLDYRFQRNRLVKSYP